MCFSRCVWRWAASEALRCVFVDVYGAGRPARLCDVFLSMCVALGVAAVLLRGAAPDVKV